MGKVFFYEGQTTMETLLTTIKEKILTPYPVESGSTNSWSVEKESATELILKMITEPNSKAVQKTAYIRFSILDSVQNAKRKGNVLSVMYGESIDDATKTLNGRVSPESFFCIGLNSGAGVGGTYMINRPTYIKCDYAISMNNNYLTLFVQGTPSFDFDRYYNAFLYFGRIVPFNDDDVDGNIALTTSIQSSTELSDNASTINGGVNNTPEFNWVDDSLKPYGIYTSKAMADISMLKAESGVYYQSHFASVLQSSEVVQTQGSELTADGSSNKWFFNASRYTDKFHASPIYVVHRYDGYRGYFENTIAISPQNLINTDILQENVGTEENPIYETYKIIDVSKNGATSFMKALSNKKYLIAIRKS